jgi:CoA:oxalate CoA-transferase
MMAGPLEGIKVLDFTWALAGPFGTMILCDLGAEVWKVEVVGLDEQRRGPGPIVDGINTYYFSVNRGKQSILLDLKTERGRATALALAEKADVVTENFSPGTMAKLGLGYSDIAARNPAIIYASTSGFGQTGPYASRGAVDVIAQGVSGILSITGHPDGPPARPGYSIGDMAGGMFTAIGVLSALVNRERTGLGQYIDVAMLDSQVNLLENAVIRYFATGEVPGRIGTRHPLVTPFQAFPTSDGYVMVAGTKDWQLFCARLGLDSLVTDPRFSDNSLRTKNHAELEPILYQAFQQQSTEHWLRELADICLVAPLNTIDAMARDPQVLAREMFVDLPAWNGQTFRVVNSPIKLSRTPVAVQQGADAPGGHTVSILRSVLGMTESEIAALAAEGAIATDGREGP